MFPGQSIFDWTGIMISKVTIFDWMSPEMFFHNLINPHDP